ncbi:hypothetical protein WA026_020000 [Henosepilachna vigintioctopunctata]|uniref:Peptidase A2B Ty3 transposon peptidase domain-containing protein n=1 Tax=Henosepilachna vigintioctopunctata TaxID=420089 RepID=A0AAW1UX80_9CUCU
MVRIEILLTCDSVKKGAPQIKVKTIKRFGENKVYMFSSQHQNAEEHKSLLNIPSVRRAVEVISNRGDYTDVVATLPEDMVGLYFDEEENFVFQDYLLAEYNKTATTNENKTMKSEELDISFLSSKKPGITPLIRLNVKTNNKRVTGIYDSGSNATLVNSRIIEEFKENIFQNKEIFRTISGVTCVDNIVKLPLKIHNIEKTIDAHVLKNDNFSYDILLGLDVIEEFNLIQDDKLNILQRNPENDKIECVANYKQNKLISQFDKKQVSPESNSINDSGHKVINLNINFDECINEIEEKSLKHLNENEKIKILEMIKHKFDVGLVKDYEAHIKMTENKFMSKKP